MHWFFNQVLRFLAASFGSIGAVALRRPGERAPPGLDHCGGAKARPGLNSLQTWDPQSKRLWSRATVVDTCW